MSHITDINIPQPQIDTLPHGYESGKWHDSITNACVSQIKIFTLKAVVLILLMSTGATTINKIESSL